MIKTKQNEIKQVKDLTIADIIYICEKQFDAEEPAQRHCPTCPINKLCYGHKTLKEIINEEIEVK